MGVVDNVMKTKGVFMAMLTLGLIGLLFLIVFGNLQGNTGFVDNSLNDNRTDQVILNLTGGAVTFFSFSNVWFTLLAVTLLIIIVVGVIGVVNKSSGEKFSS